MAYSHEIFKEVDPDKYFYLHTGEYVKNIAELLGKLRAMDDSTFKYHVNPEKNDFANWIKYVVGDDELADRMQKTRNLGFTIKAIEEKYILKKEKEESQLEKIKNHLTQKNNTVRKKVEKKKESYISKKEPDLEYDKAKLDAIRKRIEEKINKQEKEKKHITKGFVYGIIIGILFMLLVWLFLTRVI